MPDFQDTVFPPLNCNRLLYRNVLSAYIMAEALGAVGVAASLVQLADASISTCLRLYAFFSALYNAESEFRRHIIGTLD